ncbi:ribokinase [Spiractinospora alimapuensis]|uniref:ribokinase n=1 Tax=Spiractinospora alimapuensis TaxID=2820884 RepID=UPI001F1E3CA6|nr:ribokinase [Spiractinospora alimapuensis]QVQ51920.1 ribokinase [Spiractinospora alimapuensis]
MSSRVVVVGSANADLVVRVDRHPSPGETVLGSDLATFPGGKGGNQSVAAGRLGADVAFVGLVGTDAHGDFLLESMRGAGVDTGHVGRVPTATGVAVITVGADGDNTIVVSPGANAELGEDEVAAAAPLLRDAAVTSMQLEIPMPAVLAAARVARRVVLNLSPARDVPKELLELCDPLVVNEHEAAFLLGEAAAGSPVDSAKALLDRGPASVVVTLGAEGAVVAEPGTVTAVPSPRVSPVDTTGAGDAFTGALAARLADGASLTAAAAYAARVGAAAVTKEGAQSSFPRPEDVPPAG